MRAVATIKGCTKVGLNLLVFTVHPMKPGATLMSSFLFNVALILLATNAAIQFCQQSFALYANETAIFQIWGGQVSQPYSLQGPAGDVASCFSVNTGCRAADCFLSCSGLPLSSQKAPLMPAVGCRFNISRASSTCTS